MHFELQAADITIVALYFVAVFAVGVWVARGTKDDDDLFLAGRSLGWGAIGLSLFASNISSTTLIGLAGDAYATGISVANYEWMAALILVFMGAFFMPLFLRSRISTIPEFLEKRFDRRARVYFSAMTIFLSIVVDTAGGLYAGALVLRTFIPSLDLTMTCIVLAVVAGLYTAAGGLKAVVYTDMIQAVVLLVGSASLAAIMFGHFDYDWSRVVAAVPEGHLSVIRPLDDPTLPWLGTLVGLPVLGFYYWVTNQYIVQRVLGARDLGNARRGAIFAALLKLSPLFIMVLPGALAYAVFPDLPNKDLVFPTMVVKVLPVGLTGLVLAGLVAAIMSSVDSTLNSAATLVTVDFVVPRYPDWDGTKLAKVGRLSTAGFMLVAALWAPVIADFGGLFGYLQAAYAYVVPPVAVVFLLGVFWRRFGRKAGFLTLVLGHFFGLAAFVAGPLMELFELHFTLVAGALCALCLVVGVGVAGAGGRLDDDARALTWSRGRQAPSPWFARGALAVLVLTAFVVGAFW